MKSTPFKMKGYSYPSVSPLKQTDTIPDWSMSAKHFKKDVGYGSRSRTNPNKMQDNKYYYTHATPEQPHGTRTEKSLFDKALHKVEKVGRYIKHDILGHKRPEQIKREKAASKRKEISDQIKQVEFNKFLQDNPFD